VVAWCARLYHNRCNVLIKGYVFATITSTCHQAKQANE
jgi:hypothetical protein